MKRNNRKGIYKLENIHKYKGNGNPIYRSRWERAFMRFCDINENIIWWISEQPEIPYINPLTGTTWKYHPDMVICVKTRIGNSIEMIEIKPEKETVPPVFSKGKRKSTILHESKTWEMNQAKWKAAELFCKKKGWTFKILTEKHLFGK